MFRSPLTYARGPGREPVCTNVTADSTVRPFGQAALQAGRDVIAFRRTVRKRIRCRRCRGRVYLSALTLMAECGAVRGQESPLLLSRHQLGSDVLREFWPKISHKFKQPFRDQTDPANHGANPADGK